MNMGCEPVPQAAACLRPDDVLVDMMRGNQSLWTRIRVNLRHIPRADRSLQESPDPGYDPRVEWVSAREADSPARHANTN